jgi:predicted metalloprotease with PDZ domain
VAHEFFHTWNMERIRSAGIEPFNFEEADMSDDLWLGEGLHELFRRLDPASRRLHEPRRLCRRAVRVVITTVLLSPGRMFRSAVDMSRLAPFVDAAVSIDRTAWPNLFISYYTYGQAIGLGLDLSMRDRSNARSRRRLHEGALGPGSAGRTEGARQRSPPPIRLTA